MLKLESLDEIKQRDILMKQNEMMFRIAQRK